MSLAKRIILLLIFLLLLIIACVYCHTSDIYHKDVKKEVAIVEQIEHKYMEIDITKKDDKLGFIGVVNSIESLEMIDNALVYSPFIVTRNVNTDKSRREDAMAIAAIGNLIESFGRVYDSGSILYRDGELYISGETSDKEGYSEFEELLKISQIDYVDKTILLGENNHMDTLEDEEIYPELSQEAKEIEEEIAKIATINDINFEFDSATLSSDSYVTIEKIASILKEKPSLTIKVSGHTDDKGGSDYNLKLSKERANSIQNALASFGIDKNRVATAGYGDAKPLVPNDSEENRNLNRRVEIKITGE